jgi:hypothetical protein
MIWVIDRFEGGLAVLCADETNEVINVPRATLPAGAKEGDALRLNDAGNYVADPAETANRKERIKHLLQRLKKR